MTFDNNTQPNNGEANPNGAEQTPQVNEGNNTPQNVTKQEEGKFTQQQLDDTAAKARGSAERETKRKLLAQLGLKDGEEDKLLKFKEAYENSLSEDEKRATEIEALKAEKLALSQDLEEKEYTIKALIAMTGKKEEDVEKIVKMAKGLKTESNTIEDAISDVLGMINVAPTTTETKPASNENVPTGQPIQQPSTTVKVDTQSNNPFKAGQINLTEQGKLLRTNPELAKKLAQEAGVKLPNI